MKNYYRVYLGESSKYAQECYEGSFIGVDFSFVQDLSSELTERWQDFNHKFIPVWLENHPGRSKIAAGLACGTLHTTAKGILEGDTVICPDGKGSYMVGEVTEPYSYHPDSGLPHQRGVHWLTQKIRREDMSLSLRNSAGIPLTVSTITKYEKELEQLIGGQAPPDLIATNADVEDPTVFALEKHLEDFLIANWNSTELGRDYDIFEEDGELVGQQYPSDTGPMDILAISKDKKVLLVVELKRGRASDVVVGQVQRYMGYVLEDLAEVDQTVKGAIIALEDDLRLRRALKVTQGIEFYRYQVSFKLTKVVI